MERIKDPREKSIEGKVRSIQFRMKKIVYRAEPNRYLINKPSVSMQKMYWVGLKHRIPFLWRMILRGKRLLKRILNRKRYIYMPLDIIQEDDEFAMRDDDYDEIDEMWRKHYDVDCRRNRHRKRLFSNSNKIKSRKKENLQSVRDFKNNLEAQNLCDLGIYDQGS